MSAQTGKVVCRFPRGERWKAQPAAAKARFFGHLKNMSQFFTSHTRLRSRSQSIPSALLDRTRYG
jgi:hypothetical protein